MAFLVSRTGLEWRSVMWPAEWLRTGKQNGSASRRRAVRTTLESLEDRCVPSTLSVTNNLDNGSVGSLRYEIAQAKKGDTIVFAPSLDGQAIKLTGELYLNKSLTVAGPGAGELTVSGGGYTRVFEVASKTKVALSGLTISNGFSHENGGGIYIDYGGTLSVSGCTLSGNTAGDSGGGIYNAGTATVSGSTLSGNTAATEGGFGDGGGIYNAYAATLTLSNCILANNKALALDMGGDAGGGIYNAGTLTVSGCTLSGNVAAGSGGGIYNAGTAMVSGSTLSSNTAGVSGGGIYNAYVAGVLTVSNSAFSSNWPGNIWGSYTDGGGNTFS
jgi:hypothetical protein